jgi:hypothetical protein
VVEAGVTSLLDRGGLSDRFLRSVLRWLLLPAVDFFLFRSDDFALFLLLPPPPPLVLDAGADVVRLGGGRGGGVLP